MEKFLWGAATAATQVEGGYNKDGRSLSIWDVGCLTGHIRDKHTTFDTCNTYNNVQTDVDILKKLGANSYRFSISWSRLIPDGVGEVNPLGAKYYNDLIDGLVANGIEPFVTLYHWDLPQCLMEKGGLLNRDFAEWFEYYAKTCARLFGDRVKYFTTFNEPECICYLGYGTGGHAPYINGGIEKAASAAHNLLRANGKAVRILKKLCPGVKVGFSIAAGPRMPWKEGDEEAAREAMFAGNPFDRDSLFNNAFFTDAIYFGKYPEHIVSKFSRPFIYDERDMEEIKCDIDFFGINLYQGSYITKKGDGYEIVYCPVNTPKSLSDCNFTPTCIYYGAKFMSERYGGLAIYITENGVSLTDAVGLDGTVNDDSRIRFINDHVEQAVKCRKDGVNLKGYFHWSLYDNLEWGSGLSKRFGLVYTDFETFEKTPKKSFWFYKELIEKYKEI